MKHPGLRIFLGIVLTLVIVAGLVGVWVWIKIAALKSELAQNLGDALGAQVEVSSLSLDFWKGELNAAGIKLTNLRPDAPWDNGDISQATVHFHLRDLLAPTMPLTLDVSSWHLVLHSRASSNAAPAPAASPAPLASTAAPSGKSRMQVTQLSGEQGEVEIHLAGGKQVIVHGVSFESSSNGGSVWNTELRAESISAGSLEIGQSSVEVRSEPGQLTFTTLRLQCADGIITGNGDAALGGLHEVHMTLKAVNVPVTMLVAVEWQMKLSGLASGDLTYHANDQGADAEGQLSVAGGKFNVLPFLARVTSLVGLPDITGVELDKATTDFAWKDHVLHLTNIDIRKNGVTRVGGTVDVDATGQIDGHLKLGLPSAITAKWPQLQTAVFPTVVDDYNFADVHVTGTPGHLQEDLTPRLLAVGLQTGGGLLNQGVQKASDLLKNFLGP